MPKLANRPPRMCVHKPTGRACVYHKGRMRYLGPAGSAEARDAYRLFLHEITGKGDETEAAKPAPASRARHEVPLVGEIIVAYLAHADAYYRGPDGKPTREADNIRLALGPLRRYDALPAVEFGPAKLKDVRASMIAQKCRAGGSGRKRRKDEAKTLARNTINARINKLRSMFRWAVEEEMIDSAIADALAKVKPLRAGRGGRETVPVRAVEWERVEKTLPALTPLFRAAVRFMYWTGCRVGEAFALTPALIDTSASPWRAKIDVHKTLHSTGRPRVIRIGPNAQEAIRPWLNSKAPLAPVFSPRLADARQAHRTGQRGAGVAYNRSSLSQAIRRACKRAGVVPWTLAQLRHSAATRFREASGIDVASVLLGHAKPDTTAIYSWQASKGADEAACQAG